MSKVKSENSESAVSTKTPQSKSNKSNSKTGKKKRSWKYPETVASAKDTKPTFIRPPKDSQQFSSNWKALQETFKISTKGKSHGTDLLEKEQSSSQEKDQKKPPTSVHNKAQSVKHAVVYPKKTDKDGTSVSVHLHENGKQPSDSKQSKSLKRKREDGKVPAESIKQQSKKKKAEETTVKKPTEEDLWFDDVDPDDIEATVGTEAADIVRRRQGMKTSDQQSTDGALVKEHAFEGLTRAVAMDCEMVGVGPEGEDSIVARVSFVNQFGKCIYDKYVKPTERVTDYRTAVSGIRPKDLTNGEKVKTVQKEVADILQGRILVGHAIHNDLKILFLDHPKKKVRDTQKYKPFKKIVKSGRPSLKLLCEKILHVKVQQGEHSSVQDAQATMRLYTFVKKQWEMDIKASHQKKGSTEKTERKPMAPKSKSN